MKQLNLKTLIHSRPLDDSPCVSIYARDRESLIAEVTTARRLAEQDHSNSLVDKLFRQVDLWLSQRDIDKLRFPVAVFLNSSVSGFTYLPSIARNLSVVAPSFHLKPILKWHQRDKAFYIVSFDLQAVQLFQGSVASIRTIDKISYDPAMRADDFLALVHRAAREATGDFSVPTLLAGTKELTERFYALGKPGSTVPTSIEKSADFLSLEELHKAALSKLEPFMTRNEDNLVRKYWRSARAGETSHSLNELVALGLQGQVRHLFVSEKMNLWGQINYRTAEFTYSQKQIDSYDDCILDDLSELVIFHGGIVTVLPTDRMPNNHAACGILKKPLRTNKLDFFSVHAG